MRGIADTGFLVALANRRDHHHVWARDLLPRLKTPLLSCESVLSETAFHLSSSKVAMEMIKHGLVTVEFELSREWDRLLALSRQFEDQSPDLADLCVIRLSEINPKHSVLTVDAAHFRIFRRNVREKIPFLSPPDL